MTAMREQMSELTSAVLAMEKREHVPPAPRARPHVVRPDLPAARALRPVLHHDLLATQGTPDNYQYNPYYGK
eukprot:1124088-Heterocapsa_arctica.AAC.1